MSVQSPTHCRPVPQSLQSLAGLSLGRDRGLFLLESLSQSTLPGRWHRSKEKPLARCKKMHPLLPLLSLSKGRIPQALYHPSPGIHFLSRSLLIRLPPGPVTAWVQHSGIRNCHHHSCSCYISPTVTSVPPPRSTSLRGSSLCEASPSLAPSSKGDLDPKEYF